MNEISPASMKAFQDASLRTLQLRLLAHWESKLPDAFAQAGKEGRELVLLEADKLGREDPELSFSDVTLLADLRLVDWVNSNRPLSKGAR